MSQLPDQRGMLLGLVEQITGSDRWPHCCHPLGELVMAAPTEARAEVEEPDPAA